MENKEQFQVTEEQKAKFEQLKKKYSRKSIWCGLKNTFLFLLLTFSSLLINIYLFEPVNMTFAFICGMLNGLIFMVNMRRDYVELDRKSKEEFRNIFSD